MSWYCINWNGNCPYGDITGEFNNPNLCTMPCFEDYYDGEKNMKRVHVCPICRGRDIETNIERCPNGKTTIRCHSCESDQVLDNRDFKDFTIEVED